MNPYFGVSIVSISINKKSTIRQNIPSIFRQYQKKKKKNSNGKITCICFRGHLMLQLRVIIHDTTEELHLAFKLFCNHTLTCRQMLFYQIGNVVAHW